MKDYYKILGVERGASAEQIKTAYRNLAKKHHPDRGGNESSFKELNEAYEALSNPNKNNQSFRGGVYQGYGPAYNSTAFNDFFRSVFNQRKSEILDIVVEHRITIKKLFEGTTEKINYKRRILDENGNYKNVIETKEVKIEEGSVAASDLNFVFEKLGNESHSYKGKVGKLVVVIRVLDDPPLFIRHGFNVYSKIPIPITMALTGCEIEVATLHGPKKVRISPKNCFVENNPVVLKGCGLKKNKHSMEYGDQKLYFSVEIPKKMTKGQQEILKEFLTTEEYYPEYNEFLKKQQENFNE